MSAILLDQTIIPTGSAEPVMSKEQKNFNALVNKIKERKALLDSWEQARDKYMQERQQRFSGIFQTLRQIKIEFVIALDEGFAFKSLTKSERYVLSEYIIDTAGELLDQEHHPELEIIYNKYVGDVDEEYMLEHAGLLDEDSDEFDDPQTGFTFDDVDGDTPEEVLQKLLDQLEQDMAEEIPKPRKKTKKQLESEAKKEQAAKELTGSIREVYRKLASMCHPDREQDETARAHKTVLMQRLNDMYAKNDLLGLLVMQQELHQTEDNFVKNIADEKVKLYNQVLKQQVAELELQLSQITSWCHYNFDRHGRGRTIQPKDLSKMLKKELTEATQLIEVQKQEVGLVKSLKHLKAFIRQLQVDDEFYY